MPGTTSDLDLNGDAGISAIAHRASDQIGDVKLTGPMNQKCIMVQLCPMAALAPFLPATFV